MTPRKHRWVAAATVPLEAQLIPRALKIGTISVAAVTTVDVLEVYCLHCRRPYDDAADEPCVTAGGSTTHLRGGPIGTRRNRKCPVHRGPYGACQDQHEPGSSHGRPPMPSLSAIMGVTPGH